MIAIIDHQAISAAKKVTTTVNDKYPTLALAVAMPALLAVEVLAALALVPAVVNTVKDVCVGDPVLRPVADVKVVATPLVVVPEFVAVALPERVCDEVALALPVAVAPPTVMDDRPEPLHTVLKARK